MLIDNKKEARRIIARHQAATTNKERTGDPDDPGRLYELQSPTKSGRTVRTLLVESIAMQSVGKVLCFFDETCATWKSKVIV